MLSLVIFQILNVFAQLATPAPTLYDQRQTGNSNVRIDLNDAVFIAVADTFGDYDYSYDYSHLTIKPEVPTTERTTTTEETPATQKTTTTTTTTRTVSPKPEQQNATVIINASNNTLTFVQGKPNEESFSERNQTTTHLPQEEYHIPVTVLQDKKDNPKLLPIKTLAKSPKNRTDSVEAPQLRHCSPGFFLDSQNRCKRLHKPSRSLIKPTK